MRFKGGLYIFLVLFLSPWLWISEVTAREVDGDSEKPKLVIKEKTVEALILWAENIVIPHIEFKETRLSQVMAALSEISVHYDLEERGLNMMLFAPDGSDPEVTVTAQDSNLGEVVNQIVDSLGYEVTSLHGVLIVHSGEEGQKPDYKTFPKERLPYDLKPYLEERSPRINFSDVELSRAVTTMGHLHHVDGVVIYYFNPGKQEPMVTMNVRNLPSWEALNLMAASVGFEVVPHDSIGGTLFVRPREIGRE